MIHETDYDASRAGAAGDRHIAAESPQPCWVALDAAREQAFTGEIVFDADPQVRVYLDNGVAYYAERGDDVTLGRRLLDAGVVDAVQLERGTVRVGGVEHLGRLFDREPSVDRDAVMVLTEDATQALLADLANNVIATSRATAYRHHESGVHRWFVAPPSSVNMTRPVSDVALVDDSVVADLPGLPSAETGSLGDELRIEWDEPLHIADESTSDATTEAEYERDLLGGVIDDADQAEIVESPFVDLPADAATDEASFAPPPVGAPRESDGDTTQHPQPLPPAPEQDVSDALPVGDATFEDVTIDVVPVADAPVVDALVEDVSADVVPVVDALVEDVSGDVVPVVDALVEDVSGDVVPVVDALVEDVSGDVVPVVDALVEDVSGDVVPVVDALVEDVSGDVVPVVDALVEDVSGDVVPVVDALVEDVSGDVVPVVDALVEDVSGDVVPVVDALVEDVSGDVVPAVDPSYVDVPGDVAPVVDVVFDEMLEVAPPRDLAEPSDGPTEIEPLSAEFDELVIDLDDLLAPIEGQHGGETHHPVAPAEVVVPMDDEFFIIWPDGTEEAPTAAPDGLIDETAPDNGAEKSVIAGEVLLPQHRTEPVAVSPVEELVVSEPVADSPVEELVVSEPVADSPVEELVVSEPAPAAPSEPTIEGHEDPDEAIDEVSHPPTEEDHPPEQAEPDIDFEVPALVLGELPDADGTVPDEVSSAVLRAIRAIENASTTSPIVAPILGTEQAPEPPPAEPVPAPMGFAPPTLETSAEAMYAAAAAAAESPSPVEQEVVADQPADDVDAPEPRVASVVFVDDDDEIEPEPEDRAGALRRLITSLRRR